jgi:hypothetical protein
MLNLGNGLVKAGQIEAAKVIFANARYADHYSDWPYRRYLEEVANSDLNARAALYADGNSLNDPPTAMRPLLSPKLIQPAHRDDS